MTQLAIENAPSILISGVGVAAAIVLLVLRSWLAGIMIALGSLLNLVASVLSVAFSLLIAFLLNPALGADRAHLIENVYFGAEDVMGTIAVALLVAGAVFAIWQPRARAPRPVGRRFGVGLAVWCAVSLAATVALGAAVAFNAPRAVSAVVPTPTPTPSLGPGTYAAGKLRAPQTLGGEALNPPTSAKEAADDRKARDEFSKSAGGAPAIHASYGFVTTLDAAQGYISADDYFDGSKVQYSTHGQVRCGSAGVSICIRSDQSQQLTVVVADIADPSKVAALVDEAWTDEGGH